MLAAQHMLPPEMDPSPEELATEEQAALEVQQSEAPDENPFAMWLLSCGVVFTCAIPTVVLLP